MIQTPLMLKIIEEIVIRKRIVGHIGRRKTRSLFDTLILKEEEEAKRMILDCVV